ncbi:uncharacterized protein LOC112694624 [Sipha flava]|uniref:Uncharacterized protein LOC112694624 n=1 Tax=Sipha flava TaxID=143950 RepID=A0A8B8GUE6_9HEMI|nr:uncharacterized protein LOC112694624 [Sipha flava]
MVKFKAEPRDIVVIQAYFPTTEAEDNEIEEMHAGLEELWNTSNPKKPWINEKILRDIEERRKRNKGTKKAILSLRTLIEKQIEINNDTFMAFIDLEKAFDTVPCKELFRTLEEIGIDYRDGRLIYNIYKEQSAIIKVSDKEKIGVIVGGELVSFLRFADDIALVASSENDLKRALEEIARCFHNYHLQINWNKTKVIMCQKKESYS